LNTDCAARWQHTLYLGRSRQPHFNSSGRVVRLTGIVQDITDRKLAEASRLESEARLEHTFSASPIGMALVSMNMKFMKVNRAFCHMLGWSEHDLLHDGFDLISPVDDLLADQHLIAELISGERGSVQTENAIFTASPTMYGHSSTWVSSVRLPVKRHTLCCRLSISPNVNVLKISCINCRWRLSKVRNL
jgi:PAS domain S-box-containing protein